MFAVNADTGKMVWRHRAPRGEVNNTVAVEEGLVYVALTNVTAEPCPSRGCPGPYVIALDQQSGQRVWESPGPVDLQRGADLYGSPVHFDATPADRRSRLRSCTSRRSLTLRPVTHPGVTLSRVKLYLNGRRVAGLRGKKIARGARLERPPRGRFRITAVAWAEGTRRRLVSKETGRSCRRGGRRVARVRVGDDAILLLGVSGWAAEGEGGLGADDDRNVFQGSIVVLDAATGQVLRKIWTIHPPGTCAYQPCVPEGENDEYAGATVWATPAIDTAEKLAYVPTGNPFQPEYEHEQANAVLKIDIDRRNRRSFGKILAAGKGTREEYLPGADKPCVDTPTVLYGCVELDLDFGASPNLMTGPDGRKLIGAGQKSGIYHLFDAETMQPVWRSLVGPPSLIGGIVGSTAWDGKAIYGPVTIPPRLWSLDMAGGLRWETQLHSQNSHYGPPVAVANGVVYTVDQAGNLDALDAETGAILLQRNMAEESETGGESVESQGGTSVARNTIYAAVGTTGLATGFIIAYRPGAKGSAPPDEYPQDPREAEDRPPNDATFGPTVLAGPGASVTGYITPVMSIQKGGKLYFRNQDTAAHDVTGQQKGTNGQPLFRSSRPPANRIAEVKGADKLGPGTYDFYCSVHPSMIGTLRVN